MTKSFLNTLDLNIKFLLIGILRDFTRMYHFQASFKDTRNWYAFNCDDSRLNCQGSRGFSLTSLYKSEILSGDIKTAK